MEFPFDLNDIIPGRITVLESKDSSSDILIYDLESKHDSSTKDARSWTYIQTSNTPWDIKIKKRKEQLELILDEMGIASAKAQNLQSPITTLKKLINSSQQRIYTIRDINESRSIIGMLKVGIKRLFVCDDVGAYHEVDPVCLLDFYIHESKQRCGFGHELFDAMLKAEGLEPSKLAIDRPSFKCLAFLEKHYNLKHPLQQNNNFVIYAGFLADRPNKRPPIFLYNGKVLDKTSSNSAKLKSQSQSTDSARSDSALSSLKIPVSQNEIKSKTFYSSTGSLLNRNDSPSNNDRHRRKKAQDPNMLNCRQTVNSYWNKGEKNWGVQEALHSYSAANSESHGWCNKSSNCELTPINTVSESIQRKWNNQLQSSWNIFGVKPPDYSSVHKNALKQ
ncbi:alpha-tubulin N-acetyltransferase 1 [Trichonephila inaurata madagascariensis]|uniref:Alpha-tubulin N-acetyltransferase n=1 Tax=Trichonephila inaurata madagascariensis TaxID=2747483 RepID=A0A8X6YLV0_9ARAC|nr:alpha-tubulin N-acetyltransferase 1 [Trichonephila inaurata madagascariensis]